MPAFCPEVTQALRARRLADLLAELDELLFENVKLERRLTLYLSGRGRSQSAGDLRERMSQAVGQVKDRLIEHGILSSALEAFLDSMSEFAHSSPHEEMWESRSGSVAIFANPDEVRLLEVDQPLPSGSFLSAHWHLTPLLALAANAQSYWLVALRRDGAALYRASRLGIREVPAPWPGFEGGRDALADDESRDRLLPEIDHAIACAVKESKAPMILTGQQDLVTQFRGVCSYPALADVELPGDPAGRGIGEWHREASDRLTHEFLQSRKRVLREIDAQFESGRVLTDLAAVLAASHEGRIASLVAPSDTIRWGRFDSIQSNPVADLLPHDPYGRDLFQQAAEETLRHDGRVFYLESVKMPRGGQICALLRS